MTNIIETLTDGMEVIETAASTPALAFKLGQEQAARWTARGFASECIGVVAHAATVLADGELSDGQSLADVRKVAVERTGFRPVVVAR